MRASKRFSHSPGQQQTNLSIIIKVRHAPQSGHDGDMGPHNDSPKRNHQPECVAHSGKRNRAPELIRGSQGSGGDRPAFEGLEKRHHQPECLPHSGKRDFAPEHARGSQARGGARLAFEGLEKRHHQPECPPHSGKRDFAPELIRGSQGSGCARPAFEGPTKKKSGRPEPAPQSFALTALRPPRFRLSGFITPIVLSPGFRWRVRGLLLFHDMFPRFVDMSDHRQGVHLCG